MAKKPPDNLSIESSKAIAAGMTYGKWKALQSEGLIDSTDHVEDSQKVSADVLICQYCGNPIYGEIGRGRMYCTKHCAGKAYYNNKKKRTAKEGADNG